MVTTNSFKTEEENYWAAKFSKGLEISSFAQFDSSRNIRSKGYLTYKLPDETSSGLCAMSNQSEYGLYLILITGVKYLLSVYTGSSDISIGTPVIKSPAGAAYQDNPLIIKSCIKENMSFKEFLLSVKEDVVLSNKNQQISKYTLEKLHGSGTEEGSIFRPRTIVQLSNINAPVSSYKEYADAVFQFCWDESGIHCNVTYNKHTDEFVQRLMEQMNRFFTRVIQDPNQKLQNIEIVSNEERRLIEHDFNNSSKPYPKGSSVVELFEKQVLRTPDDTAVVYQSQELTYQELNSKANKLAKHLIKNGVTEGDVVALMIDRSLELPVAALGILKAGAAYMPLDPSYPKERIKYLLQNTNIHYILKDNKISLDIISDQTTVNMDHFMECDESHENPNLEVSPESLMYVLYTSGSTGEPKGVMVKRNSFVNLVYWYTNEFKLDCTDHVLLVAPISFDTAHKNIFAPLIIGGKLHIYESGVYDYNKMSDYIYSRKITVFNSTPSGFYPLVSYNEGSDFHRLTALKYIFLGGEPINNKKIKPLMDSTALNCEVINTYGPTECTDLASFYRINDHDFTKGESIPIGKPLDNTELYIVDHNMNMVPIGVVGELCIGGAGVSKGYINDPGLSDEKFIKVPFSNSNKVYRTGDLARWMPDGNIEFIGRKDNLTKVRGYRVEIGEIENALLKHQNVDEAVVIALADEVGSKTLSAFFSSDFKIPASELRQFLLDLLPEFMIPNNFIQLEKFPLNQNKKIDRKALTKLEYHPTSDFNYVAPETEAEKYIVQLWEETLNINPIGINDDFFEIGGHSLKAAAIILKVNHSFNAGLQISDLFKHPTIKELATLVNKQQKNVGAAIQPVESREYYPATSQQKRQFIMWQINKESVAYNLPAATMLDGPLDYGRIDNVFQELVRRHESLRTSFSFVNNDLVQKVHPEMQVKVEFIENLNSDIEEELKSFMNPFNLYTPPLFRVKLVKIENNKHLLLTDFHHIIFDGISMDIIMDDFINLYNNKKLEENNIHYKDYAVWQENFFNSENFKSSEEYWLNKFIDGGARLELNTDYPRNTEQNIYSDQMTLTLEPHLAAKLRGTAAENGSTLYTLMLTALNILLNKYTGQDDISIGTPSSGRFHTGLDNAVGMFVNTIVMRNFPNPEKSVGEFLEEVNNCVVESLDHEDYPFEELVDQIDVERNSERNPLFDIMFSLQNIEENENIISENEELTYYKYPFESNMTQFDISIDTFVQKNKVELKFKYAKQLFKKETIKRMAQHYLQILSFISDNTESSIKDVEILSREETEQLLADFNHTKTSAKEGTTIQDLFISQAIICNTEASLVDNNSIVSYEELDKRSNQLSRFLRKTGVKRNTVVGIMAEPSVNMAVGMLGILKAGGAYLPIDPKFPQQRINYLIKDSQCSIVLTDQENEHKFDDRVRTVLLNHNTYKEELSHYIENINQPEDLAYVIYTSGTTGKPKGVMIEHKNVVNQLVGLRDTFNVESGLHHILLAKFTFDASVQQIFLPLTTGGTLYIPKVEHTFDPDKIWEYIVSNNIKVLDIAPTHLKMLMSKMDKMHKFRFIFLGGEVLPKSLYNALVKTSDVEMVVNFYGPTETTINTTYHICEGSYYSSIPIGRPLNNYKVYLLDQNLKPVPIGVTGELCIAGEGVGRGYLNNEALTQERFVCNPFGSEGYTRMYRTGDLARWLPNGEVDYIGRADHQVNLNGVRLNPEEIKDELLQHEDITDAVAVVKRSGEDKEYLCAYLTSHRKLTSTELRQHLMRNLPEYMIPSHFVRLERIPLTSSDKVDINFLMQLEDNEYLFSGTPYEAPATNLEKEIADMWKEVLNLSEVGVNDHFFEIGGNSLTIVQVAEKLNKKLNTEISVVTLFRFTTIHTLANELNKDDVFDVNAENEIKNREQGRMNARNRLLERRQRKGGGR